VITFIYTVEQAPPLSDNEGEEEEEEEEIAFRRGLDLLLLLFLPSCSNIEGGARDPLRR